ncbi:MAG: DNA mismatch repair endonuclease MutL [Anaerolineales bacterium]
MPIEILPEDVASAIAAGEVVERPVSVVKELVENSLDASASSIEIKVERGGSGLIEVSDDGVGIPRSEVPLAVARFATSKLRTAEDLFAIQSLGFRGEALSSIGAVSRLEMVTKTAGEAAGSRLIVDGGQAGEVQSVGAPRGTTLRVRDLFFNVPARRKFLKSENTERRRISALVTRYALAYPEVRFKLTQEGRETFLSSGKGDRREILAAIYDVEKARELIAIPENSRTPFQIRGFISPPSIHRGNRRELTFFVNGRWVQDASLSAAVVQAYHALLMVGRYPMAVLFLDLPPDMVDVNVHPAKAEVRFREQDVVFSVVQRVVRSTLLGQAPSPALGLGASVSGSWLESDSEVQSDWQLTQQLVDAQDVGGGIRLQSALPVGNLPLLRAVGQIGATYLVAEGPDGLYLVDQHAAHERVLFEALMRAYEENQVEVQTLLEPLVVTLSIEQSDLLENQSEVLRQRTYRLRAIPAMFVRADPERIIRSVVEDFEEDETPLAKETEARLAARACKRAAIKAGQVLSMEEQQKLLRDLESCTAPRTCPHGRPTMIHLSVDALERQFGRRG